jgi:16S rRNA (cytidine1402-2'-O)-methyltransferase
MGASGKVLLVATPIGHRDDLTLRGLAALRAADVIACEDTRHSRPLLAHHGIDVPLVSFHEHNEAHRAGELVARAREGATVAVITDAGMPGVSDPGYRIVHACLEAGVALEVLPGPSAVLTALVGSGLPVHAFHFGGFLPVKTGKRRAVLAEALAREGTAIFFESPHRLVSSLALLSGLAPDAPACVARELTKKFETYHRGTAAELHAAFQVRPPKGEIVLLFTPPRGRSAHDQL